MLQPSTPENPWTKSSAISGNSKHLESITKFWGTQTGRQRSNIHNLFMFSFFRPSELAELVQGARLCFNWSSCFSTASARLLMPDFPAKWQLVSPRTGSCYQPESTARLINLIDLHWLENKLFEQLCLSDPISWPKSQIKHPQFVRACVQVCMHMCLKFGYMWRQIQKHRFTGHLSLFSALNSSCCNTAPEQWNTLVLRWSNRNALHSSVFVCPSLLHWIRNA